MTTIMMECEEISLERYFEKLVCIPCHTQEGNIIIYWESEYGGFRGTCTECENNWPES